MGGDLHGLLHDQAQKTFRELQELQQHVPQQKEDSSCMQGVHGEIRSDHLPANSTFNLGSIDSISTLTYDHIHKLYYIEPRFTCTNGYSTYCEYSARWYEADCTMCSIKTGNYRKRKRDWN